MSTTVPAGSPQLTRTVTVGDVEVTLDDHDHDHDHTQPFLLLHGGGGAATVRGFATLLARRTHSRVLVPTHPGFGGTNRPAGLRTTRDLAAAYIALLDSSTSHTSRSSATASAAGSQPRWRFWTAHASRAR